MKMTKQLLQTRLAAIFVALALMAGASGALVAVATPEAEASERCELEPLVFYGDWWDPTFILYGCFGVYSGQFHYFCSLTLWPSYEYRCPL